jgi:ankyrin repeat protein
MINIVDLAREGKNDQIDALLDAGASSPNEISLDGLQETALHVAAHRSDVVLLKILKRHAANPFSEDINSMKPVNVAIEHKDEIILEDLLNYMDEYLSYQSRRMRGIRSAARLVIPNYRKNYTASP